MNFIPVLIGLAVWLTLFFFLPIPIGTSYPTTRRPLATYTLMILSLLGYLLLHWVGPTFFNTAAVDTIASLGFHYSSAAPWQLITHLFLHSGLVHLLFNLFFLYLIGVPLEDKIGPARFTFLFLAGGMIAALGHGYLAWGATQSPHALIGASGAIAALIGAFFVIHPWVDFKFCLIYWIMIIRFGAANIEIGASICFIIYFIAESGFNKLGNLFSHMFNSSLAGGDYLLASPHWAHLCGAGAGLLWGLGLFGFKAFLKTHVSDIAQQRQIQRNLQRNLQKENAQKDKASASNAPSATMLTHLVSQANAQSARSEFIRLIEQSPNATLAPGPQLELAKILASLGEDDLCLKALTNLLEATPDAKEAGEAHFLTGEMLAQNSTEQLNATDHLNQAIVGLLDPPDRQRAEAILIMIQNGQTPPPRYAPPKNQKTPLIQPGLTHLKDTPQFTLNQTEEDTTLPPALLNSLTPQQYVAESQNGFSINPPRQGGPSMELLPIGALSTPKNKTLKPAQEKSTLASYSIRTLNDQANEETDPNALQHVIDFPYENRKDSLTGIASSPDALCMLILEPAHSLDTPGLIQTLAEMYHSSADSIAGRIKMQAGILHPEITHTEGVRMRDRLISVGFRCALIEHSPAWGTTSSIQAHTLRVEPNLWVFETTQKTIRIAPNDLQLLTSGRLRLTPGGTQRTGLIDMIRLGSERTHLRLWEDGFVLLIGEESGDVTKSKGSAETLQHLTEMLTQRHPNAIQTQSFRQLQTTKRPNNFKNLSLYDNYTKWHLMARYAPRV